MSLQEKASNSLGPAQCNVHSPAMCHHLIRPFNRWPASDAAAPPFNYRVLIRGDSEATVPAALPSPGFSDSKGICISNTRKFRGPPKYSLALSLAPRGSPWARQRGFCSSGIKGPVGPWGQEPHIWVLHQNLHGVCITRLGASGTTARAALLGP